MLFLSFPRFWSALNILERQRDRESVSNVDRNGLDFEYTVFCGKFAPMYACAWSVVCEGVPYVLHCTGYLARGSRWQPTYIYLSTAPERYMARTHRDFLGKLISELEQF